MYIVYIYIHVLYHEIMFFIYYVLSKLSLVLYSLSKVCMLRIQEPTRFTVVCVEPLPFGTMEMPGMLIPLATVSRLSWFLVIGFEKTWKNNRSNDGNPKCCRLLKSSKLACETVSYGFPTPDWIHGNGIYLPVFTSICYQKINQTSR